MTFAIMSKTNSTLTKRLLLIGVACLFLSIIPLFSKANATASTQIEEGKKTLVILDKGKSLNEFKQSHSQFLKLIEDLGQTVHINQVDDTTLKLSKYGEFLYDNILVLCPQADVFRGSLGVKDIIEFIDSGRNVFVVGSHASGSITSDLAAEVGFDFKEMPSKRDYSNTKLNDIYHIIGDKTKYPHTTFSYSGTQLKMLKNELSLEILSNNAPVDDIRANTATKYSNNVLIGVTQARNNARVVVSGSMDFFGDKAFETSKQANKHLARELLRWVFKRKALLRYSGVQHKKLNIDTSPPSTDIAMQTHFEGYTIMDDIEYKIKIEIYEDGKWTNYRADDVQLEFVRIDPFIRQTMKQEADGTYVARFRVPDVYGVFKFQVDYQKEGLTYLFSTTQVSVRPLRHNEYERFIYSAYPYYLSAFLMMAYLYIFSFVYLYQQKEKRNNK